MTPSRSARAATRWVAVACGIALLAALVWWFRQIHDESLYIEPGSLSYHLLVPDELKQDRLTPFGKVLQYQRSAADGPKPTIIVVSIQVDKPGAASVQRLTDAYAAIGFSVSRSGRLVRGTTELEISGDAACSAGCRVTLAMSQHW